MCVRVCVKICVGVYIHIIMKYSILRKYVTSWPLDPQSIVKKSCVSIRRYESKCYYVLIFVQFVLNTVCADIDVVIIVFISTGDSFRIVIIVISFFSLGAVVRDNLYSVNFDLVLVITGSFSKYFLILKLFIEFTCCGESQQAQQVNKFSIIVLLILFLLRQLNRLLNWVKVFVVVLILVS